MTERNPFICYVPPHAKKLVLGSFPCYNGTDYGNFFYGGSGRNHFWPILADISGMPASDLKQRKAICDAYGIALSDVALVIRRKKGNCSDSNLEIIEYNQKGIHKCLAAGVSQVFFTSTYVQKHFHRMLPGLKLDGVLLPSPSPAANRRIGGLSEYKKMLSEGTVRNVYEYRLNAYRELLFS